MFQKEKMRDLLRSETYKQQFARKTIISNRVVSFVVFSFFFFSHFYLILFLIKIVLEDFQNFHNFHFVIIYVKDLNIKQIFSFEIF